MYGTIQSRVMKFCVWEKTFKQVYILPRSVAP